MNSNDHPLPTSPTSPALSGDRPLVEGESAERIPSTGVGQGSEPTPEVEAPSADDAFVEEWVANGNDPTLVGDGTFTPERVDALTALAWFRAGWNRKRGSETPSTSTEGTAAPSPQQKADGWDALRQLRDEVERMRNESRALAATNGGKPWVGRSEMGSDILSLIDKTLEEGV